MKTYIILTTFVCISLFPLFPLFASNSDIDLQNAVQKLETGEPQEALDILLKKHDASSTNPQEWFLLGIAAKQVGEYEEANNYFEKLLQIDPNAHRAKLEMAEIAYRFGMNERAKQLLLDVKAANPPAGVALTIDRFIANIAAQDSQEKNWRIRTSLGWKYDTNANAGPDDELVVMYGLPFLLSDEAKENSDNALLVNVGFDYIKSIKDSLSWQSNLSGSWTDYQDLNNLDSIYISFSTGATWRQNSHMIWSMPLVTDWLKFGYNENYYSYSYGLTPQLRYVINKTLSANIATSISRKEYQNSVDRALMAYSFSPSFDYKILQDGTIRIALTAATERSGLDFFSNNQFGINGLYFHNFSKKLVTTIRVGYSDTNYLQNELAYPDERHDKTIRYGFDIVYHIESITSEIVFTVNQTNNSSNIDMYDYDRTQTSLLLRKAF